MKIDSNARPWGCGWIMTHPHDQLITNNRQFWSTLHMHVIFFHGVSNLVERNA